MERFDAIVVGTGGVGSAALYHLAIRGLRVLGLDQFPPAHSNGSSHGQSRIIRLAYFEHPDYVPLLHRAYTLWNELEQAAERKLFHQIGLLEVGPPDGVVIPGVMQSVTEHNLPIEKLTVDEARQRFPFQIQDDSEVVFEPTAGYLLVEECVQAHLDLATRSGATWRQQPVTGWQAMSGHVRVDTETESYETDQLIISGGAWASSLLARLGLQLCVAPKHQYWFDATQDNSRQSEEPELPTYFFETQAGFFYGFPQIAQRGLKVAQHGGNDGRSYPNAIDIDGLEDPIVEAAVRSFVSDHLPFCSDRLLSQQACMYTFSPDEDFIVDRHPTHENVVFAAGLSGHGFKFTTVLGETLANLAMDGCQPEGRPSVEFLSLRRF